MGEPGERELPGKAFDAVGCVTNRSRGSRRDRSRSPRAGPLSSGTASSNRQRGRRASLCAAGRALASVRLTVQVSLPGPVRTCRKPTPFDRQHPPRPARRGGRPSARRWLGLAAAAPAQRRRLFVVYLALLEVELARRHCDLRGAQEATRGLEAALGAAAETNELPVPPDYRALVLINLGIAELWAGRPDDARRHLEDALSHTRRIPRPFLEVGCLAHLAIAAPLTRPAAAARARAERAGARDRRGAWLEQPVADDRRVRDGRHGARADGALRGSRAPSRSSGANAPPGGRPGDRGHAPPCPRHAALRRGPVRRSTGGPSRGAQGLQRLLASEHVFTVDARGRALQVRVRMGDTEAARLALAALSPDRRNRASDPHRARGTGARRGQPRPGGRGAGARDRRFCASAVGAVGARRASAMLLDRNGTRPTR